MAAGAELGRLGAVALITLHPRPDGTMDETTATDLATCLDAALGDPGLRAIVITGGQPGTFIRHYSLEVLLDNAAAMSARGLRFSPDRPVPERGYLTVLRRIAEAPKPVIAAITGTAMGGGFELALACDIRIAQRGPFRLGLPEINVGILPGAGGTQRLARLIGPCATLYLTLLGETVTPEEALHHGMVHELVEDARARALALAHRLAQKAPAALAHIKDLVRGAWDRPLDEGLARERTLFCDLMVRPEATELMRRVVDGEVKGIEEG